MLERDSRRQRQQQMDDGEPRLEVELFELLDDVLEARC
jgi:hypothetical protein